MEPNIISYTFSSLAYAYFFAGFNAYFLWFAAPEYIKTLPDSLAQGVKWFAPSDFYADPVPQEETISALLLDAGLLLLFMVPHTILASKKVKKAMGIPVSLERAFFVLQSQMMLQIQMTYWKSFGPTIYDFRETALGSALQAFSTAGFLCILSSSFALDHFDLFGLSQAFGIDLNKTMGLAPKDTKNGLSTRWHYSIVAHPIMTGVMMQCWGAPYMTSARLLFNVVSTMYCVIGVIHSEEKKLKAELGTEYEKYLTTVPRFIPFAPAPVNGKDKTN